MARDLLGLRTEIVGVQSDRAPAYVRSVEAGHVVETSSADTQADGLAVRIPDPDALAIIMRGVSRIVTVTDDEIQAAIRAYWTDTHNLAEGAGASPLAAIIKEREELRGKKVGIPLNGGNIDLALFDSWVRR
jgi:threonine dehydratase